MANYGAVEVVSNTGHRVLCGVKIPVRISLGLTNPHKTRCRVFETLLKLLFAF